MATEASQPLFQADSPRVGTSRRAQTRGKGRDRHDEGYLKSEMVSLRPPVRRKRCEYGVGFPEAGTWRGLEVQAWLDRGRRVLVWGWHEPIRTTANVELPPTPRGPTYGPRAREEARRLRAEADHQGVELGPYTRRYLRQVIKGRVPLQCSKVRAIQAYVTRTLAEREQQRRPLRVEFGPGPRVLWRQPGV